MLSQRLCLYSPLNPGVLDDTRSIYAHLLQQLVETQEFLAYDNSIVPFKEFRQALDSSSFVDVVQHGTRFLMAMEEYVKKLEQESEKEVESLKEIMRWVTIVTTAAVCVLGLFGWFFARDQGRLLEAEQSMIQYLFHEIRNPLNHVVNGIETVMLDTPSLTWDTTQHLRSCREGGELILTLLGDVLSIAKLESGEPLDLRYICVAEACVAAVRISSLSAKPRGVRCRFIQGSGCDGYYLCDRTRLSQALLNLLSNAVKYAAEGGSVILRLEIERHTSEGHQLTFSVEDDGPGVREEDKESLFLKFRTFNQDSGTGLGLHLTRIIVRRMGGNVAVTSPVPGLNHGTVFTFTVMTKEGEAPRKKPVPMMRGEARTTADAVTTNADTKKISEPVRVDEDTLMVPQKRSHLVNPVLGEIGTIQGCEWMSALRVLVVDDDNINVRILVRKFARDPFASLRWKVDTASSLPECLNKVTSGPLYNIIILDEHFSGDRVTGSECIKTLRERGVDAAVFMCSANCSPPDVVRYMRLGAVDVLPKPVPNGETLLNVISEGLHCHQTGRSPP